MRLTDDAWFGVTPEPVAARIAEDMASARFAAKRTLVDLFAGAGGNTIAFALSERWDRIVAIERDPDALACAQHNAAAYGVPDDAITWVLGDSLAFLAAVAATAQGGGRAVIMDDGEGAVDVDPATTVLFASPPWGGVSYRDQDVFDLSTMAPYNLDTLHTACKAMDHVLYLPRTSDVRQIAKLAPAGAKIELVQYCMEGASKAMVAYIPGRDTAHP